MARPEWGTKRRCPSCTTPFYDLERAFPLACPACNHVFEPDMVVKPRKARLVLKDEEHDLEDLDLNHDLDDDIEPPLEDDRDPLIMGDEEDTDDEVSVKPRPSALDSDGVDTDLDEELLLTEDLEVLPLDDDADLLDESSLEVGDATKKKK